MKKIDPDKLAKLSTANESIDEKYGAPGTPSREKFNKESLAWVHDYMLRNRSKVQ